MMDKKVTSLLNDSLAELDVRINNEKSMSIVEFCLQYTSIRGQELIDFCEDMITSSVPSVILTEGIFSSIGDRIKHANDTVTQGAGASRDAGNNNSKPLSGSLLTNRAQKAGNWFGTRASQVRNSAMIKISGGDKGEAVRYLVFPDLDMSRAGHHNILKGIIAGETKEGRTAEEVEMNDDSRANIASRATEVKLPDAALGKNKEAVVKALDDLSKYANQQKLAFSRYKFIAPEEVQKIVDDSTGLFQNLTTAAAQGEQVVAAAGTAAVDTALKVGGTGGDVTSAPGEAYAKNVRANIGTGPTEEPKTGLGLLDAEGKPIPEESPLAVSHDTG